MKPYFCAAVLLPVVAVFMTPPLLTSARAADMDNSSELSGASELESGNGIYVANLALIHQDGNLNHVAARQYGVLNSLSVSQEGNRNILSVSQAGDENSIVSRQLGDANLAALIQIGYENAIYLEQVGFGNKAGIAQNGIQNSATVNEIGFFHDVSIYQSGNGLHTAVTVKGASTKTVVNQYD